MLKQITFCLIFIGLLLFVNSCTNNQESVLVGDWSCQIPICFMDTKDSMNLQLSIDKTTIRLVANKVACNSCAADYSLTQKQLVIDRKEGVHCTEKHCPELATFCAEDNVLTHLLQDLEYSLDDDQLTLQKGSQSLTLTRSN